MPASGRPASRERFPVGASARRVGGLLALLGSAALAAIGLAWGWGDLHHERDA